ncbi:MAG: hypothetical protein KAI47_02415 [Deltaproteobacteria bacterium]|nr:hypothetical protein [Deltaproteobacteria bacterium]
MLLPWLLTGCGNTSPGDRESTAIVLAFDLSDPAAQTKLKETGEGALVVTVDTEGGFPEGPEALGGTSGLALADVDNDGQLELRFSGTIKNLQELPKLRLLPGSASAKTLDVNAELSGISNGGTSGDPSGKVLLTGGLKSLRFVADKTLLKTIVLHDAGTTVPPPNPTTYLAIAMTQPTLESEFPLPANLGVIAIYFDRRIVHGATQNGQGEGVATLDGPDKALSIHTYYFDYQNSPAVDPKNPNKESGPLTMMLLKFACASGTMASGTYTLRLKGFRGQDGSVMANAQDPAGNEWIRSFRVGKHDSSQPGGSGGTDQRCDATSQPPSCDPKQCNSGSQSTSPSTLVCGEGSFANTCIPSLPHCNTAEPLCSTDATCIEEELGVATCSP